MTFLSDYAAGGGRIREQQFTANGNFVRPSGVDVVEVTLVAGGGGGSHGWSSVSGGNYAYCGGGGGGGGEVIRQMIDITSVAVGGNIAIGIGAGGAASASVGNSGSDGGDSTFGSFLTAVGGGRGFYSFTPDAATSNKLIMIGGGVGAYGTNANMAHGSGGGGAGGEGKANYHALAVGYFGKGVRHTGGYSHSGTSVTYGDFSGGVGLYGYGGGGGGGVRGDLSTVNMFNFGCDGGAKGALLGTDAGSPVANSGGGGGGGFNYNTGTQSVYAPSAGAAGRCIVRWIK